MYYFENYREANGDSQEITKNFSWNCPAKDHTTYTFHCVESVCNRSYSGPSFPAFGLNTERYLSVFSPKAGKFGPE